MRVVSNLFRGRNPPTGADAGAVLCRPARKDETHIALRMILGRRGRLAADADVLEFLRLAVHRRVNVNRLWIAERQGRAVWAILPVVSPGRTVLLLCPPAPREAEAADALLACVCQEQREEGVHLAQVLAEIDDVDLLARLTAGGFAPMAELVYLQRSVPRTMGHYQLPPPLSAMEYSESAHDTFADTVARTYDGSLDCPALNGLRSLPDVLRGHRATGEFDPALWTLLQEGGRPIGVSLLARLPYADACELVYLGLIPEARGRGLGHVLLQHTLAKIACTDLAHLHLAVDAGNAPALRLYTRHGLRPVGRKMALMQDLRTAGRLSPAGRREEPPAPGEQRDHPRSDADSPR